MFKELLTECKKCKGNASFPKPLMGTRLRVFIPAIFSHLSIPSSKLYLAENVDNVTTFECQLIRNISGAVPHTLVEISIICVFIAWGWKRCIHETLSVYVAEALIVKVINTLPLRNMLQNIFQLWERESTLPCQSQQKCCRKGEKQVPLLILFKNMLLPKACRYKFSQGSTELNTTRAYFKQEECSY